ncbi:hypothetical protein RI129_004640 [Pyrocoelia pectoralis]|uniref:Integrase catalytic domain-containing protein n=1 Tax=Pyrocoelia pectoralis TaxID=417401 RepID=A0AAN7ZR49_9COLE
MEELVKYYYNLGLHHNEILNCLQLNDGITLSLRHLRRILNRLKLFRKRNYSNVLSLVRFIETQISTHGKLHGYRWMHLKCLQNGFIVTQDTVRQLLTILDPVGVDTRQRRRLRRRQYYNKGPNYIWHTDCYDKLKPFGICITGCIDGYSRYIVWLQAGTNTNNPNVIAYHFIQATLRFSGCPQTLRADMGTENSTIERIQNDLKNKGTHSLSHLPSFLYGTSTTNQRIESWWSVLRKHFAQFWMNLFHGLKDGGLFSGSFIDKALVQFCFLKIIQAELNTLITEWNMHKIRKCRNNISPSGRPFVMFHTPELYDTRDYLHSVSRADIELHNSAATMPAINIDHDVYNLAIIIMQEEGLTTPTTPNQALDLYLHLQQTFSHIFH